MAADNKINQIKRPADIRTRIIYTPTSWSKLQVGDQVWERSKMSGVYRMWGPFTVVDVKRRVLQSIRGVRFLHYPDDLWEQRKEVITDEEYNNG